MKSQEPTQTKSELSKSIKTDKAVETLKEKTEKLKLIKEDCLMAHSSLVVLLD